MRLHFLSELTLNTFIMDKKRVYTFGNGQAEGKADMRNLLGGKGANLAEMNLIGVPVPPGFTITTAQIITTAILRWHIIPNVRLR